MFWCIQKYLFINPSKCVVFVSMPNFCSTKETSLITQVSLQYCNIQVIEVSRVLNYWSPTITNDFQFLSCKILYILCCIIRIHITIKSLYFFITKKYITYFFWQFESFIHMSYFQQKLRVERFWMAIHAHIHSYIIGCFKKSESER